MSFFIGLGFGFLLAATVGPMWILCLRRTLAHGRLIGIVSGLGVASADALFGCVAAFGLTAISNFLLAQQFWLSVAGGGFLCWLGLNSLFLRPTHTAAPADGASARPRNLASAYASTFALTLTNPATILAFVAIFASLGLAATGSYARAALLVLGVGLGSAGWWVLLALGAGILARAGGPRLLHAVNIVAGLSITAFGAAQLALLGR